jgi:hypothetical protein
VGGLGMNIYEEIAHTINDECLDVMYGEIMEADEKKIAAYLMENFNIERKPEEGGK